VIALEELLLSLIDTVPLEASGDGIAIEVDELELALPVESRFGADHRLLATVPRGRIATGFDAPTGEMSVAFRRSA
jgi:hypothetical protein